ncbi:hypothetical protein CK203_037143 [Vitis vinifera]|uniref:Uncharacterized protein n=1 Tax=Vitis vinifera TaxID=29760 RepID=A0A438I5P1_VITVI|nr:hypothetical protein CK203_037143 [Vitis vinifera]
MQRFQMLGCDYNKNFLLEGALPNKCEVLSSNLRSKEQCRSLFSTIAFHGRSGEKLRHLESCGTLEGLPKGIGRLISLQTPDVFIVSSHGNDECQIGDLRNLNNLRGGLSIEGSGTQGVKDVQTGHPDRMAAEESAPHVLLGNPDGVDLDSLARSVSSGRGVPTPCTRRRSPLRSIAHSTRGRILSGRLSTFCGHFISGIPCADILYPEFRAPTFYIRISHSRMGEEDVFNFSGQTYPDPLIALTKRVFLLVYSATVFS